MRDKESVTQIFILYGYEKEGDHVFMTHPLFIFPPGIKCDAWWRIRG